MASSEHTHSEGMDSSLYCVRIYHYSNREPHHFFIPRSSPLFKTAGLCVMFCVPSVRHVWPTTHMCIRACFVHSLNYPGSSDGKESACNAGDPVSIPGFFRCPSSQQSQSVPSEWHNGLVKEWGHLTAPSYSEPLWFSYLRAPILTLR